MQINKLECSYSKIFTEWNWEAWIKRSVNQCVIESIDKLMYARLLEEISGFAYTRYIATKETQ